MAETKPQNITDFDFEKEIIKGEGLLLVDFWAPWCGPCHTMAPVLEEFTKKNDSKVKVYKLDVEDNPKTQERLGIKSIPTLIFFKNGEPVDTIPGVQSANALQSKLDSLLSD